MRCSEAGCGASEGSSDDAFGSRAAGHERSSAARAHRAPLPERGQRFLPALAVSAYARQIDRQRAMDAGFAPYLTKPVPPARLVEAVEDLRDVAAAALAESA
jgi:CheY-like chemotaxis protein